MRFFAECLVILLVSMTRGFASFERHAEDPRLEGMSGAGSASVAQVWGSLTNPAGLAGEDRMVVALSVAPAPFELDELRRNSAAVVFPFPDFISSLTVSKYGFDDYRELSVRVSCALQIFGSVQAGITTGYNRLAIKGFGSDDALTVDVGLIWRITDDFTLGSVATNVNAPVIGFTREQIPQSLSLAGTWIPSPGFLLALDLVKDAAFPPEVKFGVEYQPVDGFVIRGGVANEPSSYSAGFGMRLGGFGLDYAFSRHPDLGMTHRFGIMMAIDVR
jgi:hypothetical protein